MMLQAVGRTPNGKKIAAEVIAGELQGNKQLAEVAHGSCTDVPPARK